MIIFLTWHPENFSVTETIREAVGGHVSSHVEKWSAVRRNETNVQEDAEMKGREFRPRSSQLQYCPSSQLDGRSCS